MIGYQRPSSWLNSSLRWFTAISLASIQVIPPFFLMTYANLDSTVDDRVWPCFDWYKTRRKIQSSVQSFSVSEFLIKNVLSALSELSRI
jgi:hypothetical protein